MALSLTDLDRILAEFRWATLHIAWSGAELAGSSAFTDQQIDVLVRAGVVQRDMVSQYDYPIRLPLVDRGFYTGVLFHRLLEEGTDPTQWDLDRWTQEIRRRPIALTPPERASLDVAKRKVGIYCQGLANTVDSASSKLLIEHVTDDRERAIVGDDAQRQQRMDAIGGALQDSIEGRKSRSWLKSRLVDVLQDGARDMRRIAETEAQNAYDLGVATDIAKRHGDDAKVFKRPHGNACEVCVDAYTDGATGQPRIFSLAELRENGTNFGRSTADMLPTLGPMHPHCHCPFYHLPNGAMFDAEGRIVRATTT